VGPPLSYLGINTEFSSYDWYLLLVFASQLLQFVI